MTDGTDVAVEALKTLVDGLRERPNLRALAEQLNGSRERLNEAIRDVEDALYERRLPPRMVRLDSETTLAWDGEQFMVIRRHGRGTPLLQSSMELRLHAMSADVLNELRGMLGSKDRP